MGSPVARLYSALLFVVVLFAPLSRANASMIYNVGDLPLFIPTPDLNLTVSLGGSSVVTGATMSTSTGATIPVSIGVAIKSGYDSVLSDQIALESFYLDFYQGTIFSDATLISGEQMNANGPTLTTASSVAFPGPGTYTAILYDAQQFRDYNTACAPPNDCPNIQPTLDQVRAGIEHGFVFDTRPPVAFFGVVTFTITEPDPCAAGGCVSNVLFLPGIEGSRLYEGTGCGKSSEEKLWDPTDDGFLSEGWNVVAAKGDAKVAELSLDASGASACADIYTKDGDVIAAVQGNNLYKSVMEEMQGLKTAGTIADWKPVAYDWRLSLDDLLAKGTERDNKIYYEEATSTPYIEQTLRALAKSSKTGKVTILAHSNGGLVAKALLHKLGGEAASLVDKVIMVAVPQTGAPADIGSLLVGYGAGIYKDISIENVPLGTIQIVSNQAARTLSQNAPMAYHLLPSEEYFESTLPSLADHPVVKFSGDAYAKEEAAYGATIANRVALDDFILAREGGRSQADDNDLMSLKVANASLVNYANTAHDTLDAWVPPAGIEVDQVAGWGVDATVAGIDFYSSWSLFGPMRWYRPILVEDGDGTVPVPSALAMSETPSVKRFWVDLHSYNKELHASVSHGDIFEVPQLRDFIKDLLENSTSTLPQYIQSSQPATIDTTKKLAFFLHSPLTLELTDASGNVTGRASDGSIAEGIPGSSYAEFGEVKYVTVPEGSAYHLTLHGQASGTFSLDLQESSGGVVTTTSTIDNVPTTPSTLASLSVSGGIDTASSLTVDEQGDGKTFTVAFKSGETVRYTPPAPAAVGKVMAVSPGSISIPVAHQSVASTSATTTTDIAVVVNATPTRARAAVSSTTHLVRSARVVPTVHFSKSSSTPQLAAVAAPSQQSLMKTLASGVYTNLHRLWAALINFSKL